MLGVAFVLGKKKKKERKENLTQWLRVGIKQIQFLAMSHRQVHRLPLDRPA